MSTYLVIGASGNVGAELARLLAEAGHTVRRATSRAPAAPDQVRIDAASGDGLAAAMKGADGAFLLAPPGYAQQDRVLVPMIDAAQAAGVGKVVLMSAMGANADDNVPMRKAELHLEASGLAWNIIRPNWFMQNFHTFWLHGIVAEGAIQLPVGPAKGSFIDARDIADVAARLITSHELDGRDFDLTGAVALDHEAAAAILSRETGRTIRFQDITPEAMRQGLLGSGLPADYAEFLVTILGFFKAGYAERVTDAVARITGHAPRRFEDYAREHRAAWLV